MAALSLCLLPLAAPAGASPLPNGVSVSGGRLILRYPNHKKVVEETANAADPVLSPNRHFAVYIAAGSGAKISTGSGDADPNPVWLLDTATLKTTRLVVSRSSGDMRQVLGGLSHPVFSVDGRQVFFLSEAWATSDAVHAVDLKTCTVRFLCDGNTLMVIRTGRDRGDLIVNKHKYHPREGGAYNADWLVSPRGREIKIWDTGK